MSFCFYPNYVPYVGYNVSAEPSVTGQNYTCSGGETSGAAYDLFDDAVDKYLTIDTNGESTDPVIDIDLTSNIVSANFVAMFGLNLGSSGAHANLEIEHGGVALQNQSYRGGIINDFPTIPNCDAMNLTGGAIDGDEVGSETDFLALFDAVSDSSWEINFADYGAANYDADLTISEIMIGKSFAPSVNPKIGVVEDIGYGSNNLQSGGGHKYGFKDYDQERIWRLRFTYLTETDKTNFRTMWKITEGVRRSFIVNLATAENIYYLYRVFFDQDSLAFEEVPGSRYNLTVQLKEAV